MTSRRPTPADAERPLWRLALRLSTTAAIGGVLFLLVGAFTAAWITFGVGGVCAVAAAKLAPHDDRVRRRRS
jgi:hypothetical protein